MQPYEVILHERAWVAISATKGAERRQVLALLDGLKTDPFRVGDFRQRDETARINEVALFGDWLVTFWSDHATREIRVVNLERAED